MRLLDRAAGDPAGGRAAFEDMLHDSLGGLESDPLFRRRLRSDVMNAWVAAREGLGQPPLPGRLARRMGLLGRACLYASVALCAGIAGVMAASSQALPGEPLYAVKLRIEELRVEVLPAQFRDELAVNALAERIQEMAKLSASGAAAEAVALVPPIERHYTALLQMLDGPGSSTHSEFLGHRLGVVASLVESLPAELRTLVAGVMPGLPLAGPVVDDDEPEPSPTDEPAAPARPAPAADTPTVPSTEPIAPAGQTDPGRRDDEGRDGDDDDDEDDSDDESGGDDD